MVDECSVKRERARLDSAYVLVSDSRAGQPRTSQAVLSLARYSSFLSCHQAVTFSLQRQADRAVREGAQQGGDHPLPQPRTGGAS